MPIRNFLHRRNHKERSQPTHRARKLGLLEKHKDYILRARDHHSKRERIKRLKEKALERNKDEFYFGMVKGRTEKGVHIQSRGNEALPVSIVSLLKTQDVGYVRGQMRQEQKRIEALVLELAPNVPEMRVEWLKEKESRGIALRDAGLLGDYTSHRGNKKGKSSTSSSSLLLSSLREDSGEGKVGSQGKRTIWVEGVDQLSTYPSTTPGPSSANITLNPQEGEEEDHRMLGKHRSIEDYDLEDIDEDVLVEEGELTDSDPEEEEEAAEVEAQEERRSVSSSSTTTSSSLKRSPSLQRQKEAQTNLRRAAERRRSTEKHWSYLLSLLRARQVRLQALKTASSRLNLVRSLMSNKSTSVVKSKSKSKVNQQRQAETLKEAVSKGKMTKNGLALPGNEEEDDNDHDDGVINGSQRRRRRDKVVFKFGKERKR